MPNTEENTELTAAPATSSLKRKTQKLNK